MVKLGHTATNKLLELLIAPTGLSSSITTLAQSEEVVLPAIGDKQVFTHNVSFELVERSVDNKYPSVHIYCEKVANLLIEKFRTFSGKVYMAVEVRFSQDRLEALDRKLDLYVDAVARVLDQNRGDWGQGIFFAGAYQAVFGPVKHGGRNFIQIAKITFELEVSSN